jgi:flagellar basal body-associated protein FliL
MSIRNVDAGKRRRLAIIIILVSVVGTLLIGTVVAMQKAGQDPAGNTETVAPPTTPKEPLTTPKDGENREWTPERMRSASPAPMPGWP